MCYLQFSWFGQKLHLLQKYPGALVHFISFDNAVDNIEKPPLCQRGTCLLFKVLTSSYVLIRYCTLNVFKHRIRVFISGICATSKYLYRTIHLNILFNFHGRYWIGCSEYLILSSWSMTSCRCSKMCRIYSKILSW